MNIFAALFGKGGVLGKFIGALLMIAGAIVLLFCVPVWFWTLLLGLLLIASGFLVWRFCG